jgi:hypothetical protein
MAKLIADKQVTLVAKFGLDTKVVIEFPVDALREEVYDCIARAKGRMIKYCAEGKSVAWIPSKMWDREHKKLINDMEKKEEVSDE